MISSTLEGTFGAASMLDHSTQWFDKARQAGFFHKILSILTHHSYHLLDLNNYPTQKRYGHYAGQRDVPLNEICGTEGRPNDFDDRFHPLSDRTRQRWMSVARANEQGINLPPVELIQVGHVYFVRDGHHRISVARTFGQTTITAKVIVW